MSKTEKALILEKMHERTKKATESKLSAQKYLMELGVLTAKGNYTKRFRPVCIKNKAA